MANVAQMVNVLQAMILTDGGKMVLTPTYHVFEMYKPYMDATVLPVDVNVSTADHLVEGNAIRLALSSVKGVGASAMAKIACSVRSRKSSRFSIMSMATKMIVKARRANAAVTMNCRRT